MIEYDHWVVLFDLEGCLIKHWDDPKIINVDALRGLLTQVWEHNYTYIYGIYSYALWREDNRNIVVNQLVPQLEPLLGIEFNEDYIFSTSHIIDDFSQKHCPINYGAYCSVISKEQSIMTFIRDNYMFKDCSVLLVDPTVTHGMNVFIPGQNTLMFINSNRLIDFVAMPN